jgi:hypothetical protein
VDTVSPGDPEAPKPADDESVERLRQELEAEKRHIAALEVENAALLAARVDIGDEAATPKSARRSHRFWVAILLVVACLLTPLSIIALFVKNEIGDTGRYVQTIKPLSSNPAIQAYVASDVSDELFARVDIKKYVKEALPKRADPLAGPLTSALQTFVQAAVLRVLQTDQFQTIWIDANRLAHSQLVNVLTGQKSGTVAATSNGAVTINLSEVSRQVQAQLESSGIDLFSSIPISSIGGKITVFQSDDLYRARSGFKILNTLAFVLPFVILGCFIGVIYLSKSRRKGFVSSAIAFALGAVILAVVLAVGRGLYLNAATSNNLLPYDAAAAMFDTLVRFLHQSVRAVLFFSVIVIVAVFFAGPSRFAVWFRTRVRQIANWLGHETERAGWEWLAPNELIVRRKNRLRIAVAVVAFLILFRWNHPTASVVVYVALITLILLALIEFFGREPLPEEPAPDSAATTPAAVASG